MWKIGSVSIENRIVAAPLAGISNPVYRSMCRQYGAGLVVSEMISDKALHYENKKTKEMCATVSDEHPVSLQLFGSDPETMGEASRYLSEHTDCDIIDINMGCPVTKVIKAHAGSWLMMHPETAADVVRAVKENTDRPVTVKIRAGWDSRNINCAEFAALMEESGADAIAVHGRTKAQMYEGSSNNGYIRMVKEAVKVPVIGNGDIKTADDAKRMMEETGCDAVMIGRGLLGRPFFLKELNAALEHREYTEPDAEEKMRLAMDYAERLCAYEGEHVGMRMMRSMAPWYIAGMPMSKQIKNRLAYVSTLDDMRVILDDYRKILAELSEEESAF
ncbi:MAG: tRNA dihydrouridine synthase DusB [Solobacterium sp.]|nr:tRNA dihydrouridine synthase DusB [Solobacterium sp.]